MDVLQIVVWDQKCPACQSMTKDGRTHCATCGNALTP